MHLWGPSECTVRPGLLDKRPMELAQPIEKLSLCNGVCTDGLVRKAHIERRDSRAVLCERHIAALNPTSVPVVHEIHLHEHRSLFGRVLLLGVIATEAYMPHWPSENMHAAGLA